MTMRERGASTAVLSLVQIIVGFLSPFLNRWVSWFPEFRDVTYWPQLDTLSVLRANTPFDLHKDNSSVEEGALPKRISRAASSGPDSRRAGDTTRTTREASFQPPPVCVSFMILSILQRIDINSPSSPDHVWSKFKRPATNGERHSGSTEFEQMQRTFALIHI